MPACVFTFVIWLWEGHKNHIIIRDRIGQLAITSGSVTFARAKSGTDELSMFFTDASVCHQKRRETVETQPTIKLLLK